MVTSSKPTQQGKNSVVRLTNSSVHRKLSHCFFFPTIRNTELEKSIRLTRLTDILPDKQYYHLKTLNMTALTANILVNISWLELEARLIYAGSIEANPQSESS